ncbi:MAG: hypothetical protein KAG34_07760 [Cocleimonas sp.]|nr:hypothetical protein [Cocleimonas sp.]
MKKRTFSIDCTNNKLCPKLHKVLTLFINNAFPPNGSDCAQATRSSLLELSEKIKRDTNSCEISARQRPLLKTAIIWYFDEIEVSNNQRQALLLLIAKQKKTKLQLKKDTTELAKQ